MPSSTTVVVVDDHPMVRDGLAAVLGAEPDIEVAGVAGDVAEARVEIDRCRPSVVVTDYQLPDGSGLDVARFATTVGARTLLISAVVDGSVVADAVAAGCTGFVHKGHQTAELAAAVRSIAAGVAVFPAEALGRLVRREQSRVGADLSARELEVLRLVAAATPVRQIASELFISVHTVRNHIRSIMSKLDARTQLEAVVVALRNGLIDIDGA